jgi:DNA recombination protein RmuC
VINLPDGKKNDCRLVSLTAYEKYINEEDDEVKVGFKNTLNKTSRRAIGQELSGLYKLKAQILCIIPIEPAFALALNGDTSLYNKAFEKNIVIVTPATLLATLND